MIISIISNIVMLSSSYIAGKCKQRQYTVILGMSDSVDSVMYYDMYSKLITIYYNIWLHKYRDSFDGL